MSDNLVQDTKASLQTLNAKRQSLELEADAIVSELTDKSNGIPIGIDTPLVDSEGYPRADIDVYRARTLRGRLAVIRNDHKALMKDIEKTLQHLASLQNPTKTEAERKELEARRKEKPKPKYDPVTGKWVVMNWDGSVAGAPGGDNRRFDNLEASTGPPSAATATTSNTTVPSSSNSSSGTSNAPPTPMPSRPFARVNSVARQSPAEQAGLLENDLILAFGSVSLDSHDNPMPAVGELVPRAAGQQAAIDIVVRRPGASHKVLQLTPRPWSGRGLIGCHILPYEGS